MRAALKLQMCAHLQARRFPGCALEAHVYGECVFKCTLAALSGKHSYPLLSDQLTDSRLEEINVPLVHLYLECVCGGGGGGCQRTGLITAYDLGHS